ncbi:MAG: hypothetical protein ABIQ93_05545, partial [Saprospiraceae bacterium]
MKQMLLAIFSALFFGASAQVTVTSATFPSAGDTLDYALDINPGALSIATPPGGNQTWNLLDLQADQISQLIYLPASAGVHAMSYPEAELVVIAQNSETYYDKTNTHFALLGYAGADANSFGVDVVTRYSPALVERKSPLQFFDIFQQTTDLNLPFATDQIPDSVLTGLPLVPDSVRVRVNMNRLDVVDGWGTCQIPGGNYDVLRVKRTEYRTRAVDVYLFLGWVDVSSLLGNGSNLGGLIGTDTTTTFRFYSNVEKEDIAVATMSSDLSTVEQVRFKNNTVTPTIDLDSPGSATIQAYPNPAVEWVRFNCANLPQGDYTLKIFNIIGKVVWKENYKLT